MSIYGLVRNGHGHIYRLSGEDSKQNFPTFNLNKLLTTPAEIEI